MKPRREIKLTHNNMYMGRRVSHLRDLRETFHFNNNRDYFCVLTVWISLIHSHSKIKTKFTQRLVQHIMRYCFSHTHTHTHICLTLLLSWNIELFPKAFTQTEKNIKLQKRKNNINNNNDITFLYHSDTRIYART